MREVHAVSGFQMEEFLFGGVRVQNGPRQEDTHSPIATGVSGFSHSDTSKPILFGIHLLFFFSFLFFVYYAVELAPSTVQLEFVDSEGKIDECELSIHQLDLEIMHYGSMYTLVVYRCQEGLEHERRVVESGDPT